MLDIELELKQKLGDVPEIHISNPAYLVSSIKEIAKEHSDWGLVLEATLRLGIPQKYLDLEGTLPASALVHRWIHELCDYFPVTPRTAIQAILLWGSLLGRNIQLKDISETNPLFHRDEILSRLSGFFRGENDVHNYLDVGPTQFIGLLRDHCAGFNRENYALLITRKHVKVLSKTSNKNINEKIEQLSEKIREEAFWDPLAVREALHIWAVLIGKESPPPVLIPTVQDANNADSSSLPPPLTEKLFIFGPYTVRSVPEKNALEDLIKEPQPFICAQSIKSEESFLVLTNMDRIYAGSVNDLENSTRWETLFSLHKNEQVKSVLVLEASEDFFVVTDLGRIKVYPAVTFERARHGIQVLKEGEHETVIHIGKLNPVKLIVLVSYQGQNYFCYKDNNKWKADSRFRTLLPDLMTSDPNERAFLCEEITDSTFTLIALSKRGYLKKTSFDLDGNAKKGILFKATNMTGGFMTSFQERPQHKVLHVRTKNRLISSITVDMLHQVQKGPARKFIDIASDDTLTDVLLESLIGDKREFSWLPAVERDIPIPGKLPKPAQTETLVERLTTPQISPTRPRKEYDFFSDTEQQLSTPPSRPGTESQQDIFSNVGAWLKPCCLSCAVIVLIIMALTILCGLVTGWQIFFNG